MGTLSIVWSGNFSGTHSSTLAHPRVGFCPGLFKNCPPWRSQGGQFFPLKTLPFKILPIKTLPLKTFLDLKFPSFITKSNKNTKIMRTNLKKIQFYKNTKIIQRTYLLNLFCSHKSLKQKQTSHRSDTALKSL